MPGCCSKGTDSDLELRARNAPTKPPEKRAPPPIPPPPPSGTNATADAPAPTSDKGTKDGNDGSDGLGAGGKGGGGGGGVGGGAGKLGISGNKTAENNDEGDDDDLPLIIEAVVEEPDDRQESAAQRAFNGWPLCLLCFLLCGIVAFLYLGLVFFLGNDASKVKVVKETILLPAVLHPMGVCLSNPCRNMGACFASPDHPSKYICTCRTGFSGKNCSLSDPCGAMDPCKPRGKCLKDDVMETFSCFCYKGWKGKRCNVTSI